MDTRNCANGCDTINLASNWPGAFSLTYLTGSTTTLKIQMSVTIKKMPTAKVVENITTSTNSDSSLIYLSDIKPGNSYVITSKSSKVSIKLPVAWNSFDLAEFAQLNNVFVYDGGKNVGTLNSRTGFGYVSQSNTITLVAVSTVDIRGAVFITDYSNVALLELLQVYYTPVFIPDGTGWATIDGGLNPDKEGALTIVADKDGKTSLTVRLINNFGEGGQFSYMYGGPKAEHNTNPLTGNSLPRALAKSQMVTFYISKGMGNIKYTIKT